MLHTLTAQDFMVRRVITLHANNSVSDAIRRLCRHQYSGAPVAEQDGRFVGVFSEKCCLKILSLVVMPDTKVRAAEVMQADVVTLSAADQTMQAITRLLDGRISGAPVIDDNGQFEGVFSERTAMRVVLDSVYEQVPVGPVGVYMDTDPNRVVSEDTSLETLINLFLATPYRRLVVLRGRQLLGLISRRDVIQAALPFLDETQGVRAGGSNSGFVPVPERLPVSNVGTFMDRNARAVSPEVGLLEIAHIFLTTNYRRLPVLEADRLVGQVSRRDLLVASHSHAASTESSRHAPLYISGVNEELPPNLRARL